MKIAEDSTGKAWCRNRYLSRNNHKSDYIRSFFSNFPAAVEFYDKNRIMIWMNQVAKSKWKSRRNSLTGKFFVQKINNLKDPEFHAAVNKAYEGEVQIYSGKDYHQNNKD